VAFKVVDGLRTIEFGTPGAMRDELIELVINGNKRATAATAQEYVDEKEVIEQVGEELYLLGNDGEIRGKVQIAEVTQCAFKDVPDKFALAEAEGDLTGDDFRRSHLAYWNRIGVSVNDETTIVLLYFDLIEKY
jgi:uncharacterized protein YhfF